MFSGLWWKVCCCLLPIKKSRVSGWWIACSKVQDILKHHLSTAAVALWPLLALKCARPLYPQAPAFMFYMVFIFWSIYGFMVVHWSWWNLQCPCREPFKFLSEQSCSLVLSSLFPVIGGGPCDVEESSFSLWMTEWDVSELMLEFSTSGLEFFTVFWQRFWRCHVRWMHVKYCYTFAR